MADGYKRQLVKYQVMLKLAEKQKEYEEVENMVKLEEVILARQVLIEKLEEMNNKLKPLRDDVINILGLKEFSSTALLEAVPIEATRDLAETLSQLGEVLYAIKELDQANENLLRKKLSQVNTKLDVVQQKNLVQKAYKKKNPESISEYIDKNK